MCDMGGAPLESSRLRSSDLSPDLKPTDEVDLERGRETLPRLRRGRVHVWLICVLGGFDPRLLCNFNGIKRARAGAHRNQR